MMLRKPTIATFYNKKQVCFDSIRERSYSKSPLKPYLLMERIHALGLESNFDIHSDFQPFTQEDFHLAHSEEYVNNVFNQQGNYQSNGVPWSENLVESVRYTNSAMYHAIKHSLGQPDQLCFAPVSGMHHATPTAGQGFCTFSGQVIASLKLYDEFGVSGAWLDLDGHYGNSIEDSRYFVPRLNQAIPLDCNVNPSGRNAGYVQNFREKLEPVRRRILAGEVHYVVFAHGADSHIDDDLGGQCDTAHWLQCAEVFTQWVADVSEEMGKPLPVTLALFGGYRSDDYNIVLHLHLASIERCRALCGEI
jgi:acetoin utilization deacetylase AcuC-like enzyme